MLARSIAYFLSQAQDFLFQEAFDFGLMIATRLLSYEPFMLKYTFRFWDKSLICENFLSFYHIVLGMP